MIGYAISKHGVKIRLPIERWYHITESHDYMSGLSDVVLDVVNDPEMILHGKRHELIAIRNLKRSGEGCPKRNEDSSSDVD